MAQRFRDLGVTSVTYGQYDGTDRYIFAAPGAQVRAALARATNEADRRDLRALNDDSNIKGWSSYSGWTEREYWRYCLVTSGERQLYLNLYRQSLTNPGFTNTQIQVHVNPLPNSGPPDPYATSLTGDGPMIRSGTFESAFTGDAAMQLQHTTVSLAQAGRWRVVRGWLLRGRINDSGGTGVRHSPDHIGPA